MKTLLVYYSETEKVSELCSASARDGEVDVVEINDRYYRDMLYRTTVGSYLALAGLGSKIKDVDIDLDLYDSVILATTLKAGSISPQINEFLHKTNLNSKNVTGLILSSGKVPQKAIDSLRNRIKLAGGSCRDAVCVSSKELKETECDVFSYAQEKLFGAMA